jgi:Flp pilus assembly protein TadG
MGMPTARARRKNANRPGAILAMELLLVLPLMMAIFFGTVEYGMLLAAEARLSNASREGARVAAAGGNLDDVKAAVKASLLMGEQNLVEIQAVLTDPPSSTQPVSPGSPVTVNVSAPAKSVGVPDYLRFVGFSIANRCLIGQTVMRKE